MKYRYVVVAGSNYPDSYLRVESAREFISCKWEMIRSSSIYTSPDMLGGGCLYHNAVIEFESEVAIDKIDSELKDYEKREGRTKELKEVGRVPIDIDIVVCDGIVVRPKDYNTKYFMIGYRQLFALGE